MEEDIKNMSKEELLEYLEEISQQLDNIALDQIQFAISELQFFKEEYKKLEEENKELIQEKINNSKMISLAQNAILSYEKGYNDGKNLRKSAVQIIVENQQYYIFKKQIERYEKYIKKLEEENKKLKDNYKNQIEQTTILAKSLNLEEDAPIDEMYAEINKLKTNSIPISVIQNKIEEVNNSNGYSPVNKKKKKKVLNEILEEGRR